MSMTGIEWAQGVAIPEGLGRRFGARMVLLAGLLLGACRAEAPMVQAPEADGLPRDMAPAQIAELLAEDAIVLVDVREDDEWAAGHVEGAIHVPLGELAARLEELPDDKPVVTMCRSGRRSRQAFGVLSQGGRDGLHHMDGGILAWQKEGLPVERP
jgi:rhodanese-related sulfurtransferase